ncbi:MAG: EAL domain-containing protein [Eubacterium sp.]|nr:EAL domain-containing protein [Eubacterium sp.]
MENNAYDSLTGLPNMNYFLELADEGMKDIFESGKYPAMLSFNLNGLKMFNQKYGIEEGQNLIISFGRILEKYFERKCSSRFGEDHFYAFAESTGVEFRLYQIFDDLRNLNNGRSLPVRVGIYVPSGFGDGITSAMACDRARTACDMDRKTYESKFTYFTKQMEQDAKERDYILNNLDEAIEKGYIKAFYQPKIRALDGKLCGAEVLARWDDPVYGFMAPASFIPILEDSNLTYKLDQYILEQLSKDLKNAMQEGKPIVPVAVNLSRTDFEMTDPLQVMMRIAAESGVPRKFFRIEITESTVMQDPGGMKEIVERFQHAGFAVDMDDFGSAYSSLAMLREFSFNSIKIDMGFLRNFNTRSKTILQSIVCMSKSLGMHTVAEGVDNEEQFQFLKSIGCEIIQGYYFGKPAPFARFNEEVMEKGIATESELEWEFYNEIGLEDLVTDEPIALQYFDGNTFELVFYNGPYKEIVTLNGYTMENVVDQTLNTQQKPLNRQFRDILSRAMQSSREESLAFVSNDRYYFVRVKMLASYEHGCMFKVVLKDITFEKEVEANLDSNKGQAFRIQSDDNSIWNSFVDNIDIKIFWKDDKRRFLGASKSFLDYYGIESLSTIIGKTDEDIGWNTREEKYKADEYRVLNGEAIHKSVGETIVNGIVRKIQATKFPIERGGRVVGLIGYFVDIEADLNRYQHDSRVIFTNQYKNATTLDNALLPGELMIEMNQDIPVGYSILKAVMEDEKIVDLQYLYANKRFCDAFGQKQQMIIGQRFSEVYGTGCERWIERAGKVLLENKQLRKSEYVERLNHWVNFIIAPTKVPGYCVNISVFNDSDGIEQQEMRKNATRDDIVIRIAKMMNVDADYDSLMNHVLKELSSVISAQRLQIMEIRDGIEKHFFEWCAESVTPMERLTHHMSEAERRAWSNVLREDGIIDIEDVEELRDTAQILYQRLRKWNIYNLYAVPFYSRGELTGFISAANYDLDGEIDVKSLLEAISTFIANKMFSYQLLAQLDHVSHFDALTGVQNRNAYLATCKKFEEMRIPLGVIFTDLNGLKERNDKFGHKQGDIFLIDVANILCDLYDVEKVYRVGGDEFVVLLPGKSEVEFARDRVKLENTLAESPHVSLSPGFAWTEDSAKIVETINAADKAMYEYKMDYYKSHERRKER